MRSVHHLSAAELTELATGVGEPATLRKLWRAQHSRRLLTLRLLFDDRQIGPEHAAREAIVAADGLLMVTPEYNNSVPGVFKNAIDWLSRPASDIARVFRGLPVGLVGASPGPFGTVLSQSAWLPVLRTLGTAPWFGGRMMVTRAADAFDADGTLVDEQTRKRLESYLAGFAAFVEGGRR